MVDDELEWALVRPDTWVLGHDRAAVLAGLGDPEPMRSRAIRADTLCLRLEVPTRAVTGAPAGAGNDGQFTSG
jgi:hypothetical protein